MDSINQDQLIYDRARKKVNQKNIIALIAMCIYFITIFILFQLQILTNNATNFTSIYIGATLSQLSLFGLIFLLQTSGKKIYRFLYWLAWLYSLCMLYLPIYFLRGNLTHWLSNLIWFISLLVEIFALHRFGRTLKKDRWATVFFDKEVILEEGLDENDVDKIYLDDPKEKMIHHFEIDEEVPYELPQLCLRLGICVYGSMVLFPILLHIGSSLFASNDLKTVFATKDIFIFCIISAIIWTIPLFLYYYNHPYARKVTIGCIVAEGIRILFFIKPYIGYFQSHMYSIRVFILFALVEIVRYWLLFYSISPIWKIDMPEMVEDDEDEYEE